MKNLIVVLVALGVARAHPVYSEKPEDFCNGLECPKYELVNKTDMYELRCYPTYKWSSTLETGLDYKKAVGDGFMRLFDYISGDNMQHKHIEMTAPVAVQIQPGQGPFCKNNFTVNFFEPFEYQEKPIPPSAKNVFVSTMPKMCAYVMVYPGFGSNVDAIQKYAEQLGAALQKDGLGDTYRTDMFFYAGYDSPFKLLNRHNEIWFIKK